MDNEDHQTADSEEVHKIEMNFKIVSRAGRSRHGILKLAHGCVETPVFMPVGTQGTMKGLTPEVLIEDSDCQILLSNTYHLGHRPGHELIKKLGGLHKFMNWPRNILTDSGGFQMVSLSKLMSVTEEGVFFESPHTGEQTVLTPEKCIEMQENIGADIIMQLDHVVHSLTTGEIVEEAMQRSIRWLDRCRKAQTRTTDQVLFPIIQGGLNLKLREICTKEMVKRATVGIAIGGLSGGEEKDQFWRVVAKCCEWIPEELPRYVMGVGWPVDLIVASLMGADMYDCVFPTRTARFGTAITRRDGELHLTRKKFENDTKPIDSECQCSTCQRGYSRAFLHAISKETITCQLLSIHNIHHHLDLMRRFRKSVDENSVQEFLSEFLREQFETVEKIPEWVRNALEYANYSAQFL